MKYVGMYTQVSRNNKLTIMLLLFFPALTLLMVWLFYVLLSLCGVALDGNAEQVGGNVNWTWGERSVHRLAALGSGHCERVVRDSIFLQRIDGESGNGSQDSGAPRKPQGV